MDKIELGKNELKELFVEYYRLIFEQNLSYLLTRTSFFKYSGSLDKFEEGDKVLLGEYKNFKIGILSRYLIEKQNMTNTVNKDYFNEILLSYFNKHPRKMFYGQGMLSLISHTFPEKDDSFESLLYNFYENINGNRYSKKVMNHMYPIIKFYIYRNGLPEDYFKIGNSTADILSNDVVNFSERMIRIYEILSDNEREEIDNRLFRVSKRPTFSKCTYGENQQKINKLIKIFNSDSVIKSKIFDDNEPFRKKRVKSRRYS